VRHPSHGRGTVRTDDGLTAIVRFEHGIEECKSDQLTPESGVSERAGSSVWDAPLEVLTRMQAEAIQSVNAKWGVFTRSRIDLLPHQLWVCHEVTRQWPARWLVADDVGLGKTIEARIILTSLLSQERVNRLLVMCPASLVEQWQKRLREMFDIRLAKYTPDADTDDSGFWHTHSQVVVSLHTLRADHDGRHDRLLDADPWDLVIVDESHHLNADEKAGPTLAYQLLEKLEQHERIGSMIFFTGTPHRGKTYGFLAQLHLLRPDLFDPERPLREQLKSLGEVVIRNNKQVVTDLHGKKLFKKPLVGMETYQYSAVEAEFYQTLTDFILMGRAYASGLSRSHASSVMLVLITMQKLASSSVAAIRKAIQGRLARIADGRAQAEELDRRLQEYRRDLDEERGDAVAEAEEQLTEIAAKMQLMEDEEPTLRALVELAESIEDETKIERLVALTRGRFKGRSVLFFTEYKATQSLIMSALIREHGADSVTFINGDGRAEGVLMDDGQARSMTRKRADAAKAFNAGSVRFLVSTEAAGEGIDLQEHCHTLVHVDLPWNPMRLHQRVGRLHRYGQTEAVEIFSLRNSDTVEAHIWAKLDEKLDRINEAFAHVMDDPEDLKQLVLGVTSPSMFQNLFADSVELPKESLSAWFDTKTASIGGEDIADVVEALVGSVRRFNFQAASDRIPTIDLTAMRPFIEASLALNGRKTLVSEDDRLTFKTPETWRVSPAVRSRYEGMTFDRKSDAGRDPKRLLGIGHRAVDEALGQAKDRAAALASIPSDVLKHPLVVVSARDRVTGDGGHRSSIYGVFVGDERLEVLQDWELLNLLNDVPWRRAMMREPSQPREEPSAASVITQAEEEILGRLPDLEPELHVPEVEALAVIMPAGP
jgi:ERCC4-related helicase